MAELEEALFLGTKELRHKGDQALRSKPAVKIELRGNSITTFAFMASTKIALIFNVGDCTVSKAVSFSIVSFSQKFAYPFS